ncbi:hypothetical protein [Conchiformibius kuhniae]|uniref:Uncharacterized protein n=1 Tax=Conchiformibius kuhniae TaxID=211502 RepID=A0A8T9MVS1_9NEIS|nr:hypothetical protein [Conchiformibius kuhniae]UOP04566.1 hypothetical protein LVJ77_09945 [Conchiformibius kuhniae]
MNKKVLSTCLMSILFAASTVSHAKQQAQSQVKEGNYRCMSYRSDRPTMGEEHVRSQKEELIQNKLNNPTILSIKRGKQKTIRVKTLKQGSFEIAAQTLKPTSSPNSFHRIEFDDAGWFSYKLSLSFLPDNQVQMKSVGDGMEFTIQCVKHN